MRFTPGYGVVNNANASLSVCGLGDAAYQLAMGNTRFDYSRRLFEQKTEFSEHLNQNYHLSSKLLSWVFDFHFFFCIKIHLLPIPECLEKGV